GQGIMVYFVADQLWGMGYEGIQQAIDGRLSIGMMILLVFGRILSTTFTLSSGGSGGVIAPSLFIGAMIGGAVGKICMVIGIAPQATPIGIYVVIGMASLYASVGKVPFALPLIIMEATHNMSLMLPLFVASAIGYMFSGRLTIYESQPLTIDSSCLGVNILGETEADLLEPYLVKDFMEKDRPTFSEDTALVEVLRVVKKSRYLFFPVVQNGDCLTGAISIQSLKDYLLGEKRAHSVVVKDVAVPIRHIVTQDCTLKETLEIFRTYGIDHLPVVESDKSNKFVGILTKRAVLVMLKQTIGINGYDPLKMGNHLEEGEIHDPLTDIAANQVMVKNVETVRQNMTTEKLIQFMEHSPYTGFPVVSAEGELLGMVTYADVHRILDEGLDTRKVTIEKIIQKKAPTAFPGENLGEVVRRMHEFDVDRISIVDRDNPKRLIGMITRTNIMAAYQSHVRV
ncbi:MAG: CBS domain-containing protein, partial [Nitrospiria bacterium]